jgi:hypothetical protein
LITTDERTRIVEGLRAIGADIEAGRFEFKTELEDIHMNIERELTNRIGEPGAKAAHRSVAERSDRARSPTVPARRVRRAHGACAWTPTSARGPRIAQPRDRHSRVHAPSASAARSSSLITCSLTSRCWRATADASLTPALA